MILQHIEKLDDSKFKPLKGKTKDKWDQLYDNLWSMFDIESFKTKGKSNTEKFINKLCDIPEKLCVANFAWTPEVEEQFEKHPYHKGFIKYHRDTHHWFVLDSYPVKAKKSLNKIEIVI